MIISMTLRKDFINQAQIAQTIKENINSIKKNFKNENISHRLGD